MPKTGSPIFEESGFKVDLSTVDWFRFSECPGYKEIKGLHLKEMDFGWWDSSSNRLILLELKGVELWSGPGAFTTPPHKHLIDNLRDKITDTLLMLSAAWLQTNKGNEIRECLPASVREFHDLSGLSFIVLVDTPESSRPLLGVVKDAVNGKLAGKVRLFDVKNVAVLDLIAAQKMGLPVAQA